MARQDHSPITDTQIEEFLDGLAEGKSVLEAAGNQAFRRRLYRHRTANLAFAEQWRVAYDEGTDILEKEAHRRAVEGVTDFRLDKEGVEHPFVHYSDTLLIFLLKARRPDRYRDNVKVEHGGADGKPIAVEVKHSVDDLARVASILAGAGALGADPGADS